jgi:aspartyl-tRNA synthetase
MSRYGIDRPDTRFGLELVDLTDLLAQTEFKVFRGVIDSGGAVRGINAGRRDVPRSVLDGFIGRAQELGAKGLVWAFREGDGWRSPTAKFLADEELRALNERFGAEEGDLLLVVADKPGVVNSVLAQMRLDLAERFDLIPPGEDSVLWVVDWPVLERDDEAGDWKAMHHPFTAPAGAFDPDDPGSARALAYDVIWNGQEIGGGSIRINSSEVQKKVLTALGISDEEAEARFGFFLEALRYGAPPHGGIAYGLDRIVQRLHGADTIRDVIAFPKTASGYELLTGAPAPVDRAQLRELGLGAPARPAQ